MPMNDGSRLKVRGDDAAKADPAIVIGAVILSNCLVSAGSSS